ncbi:5802_t:CDS:2, partial [Cetraspora pellucida]
MEQYQDTESDTLLENKKIEEIVAKLLDESSYAPETTQAITTYLQVIDEPTVTEDILDDDRIVAIIQAEENKELIRQEFEDDDDEVPDPSVTATEVYNAIKTVICYKKQKNSELNLFFEELSFLKQLLKEYKH